MTSAGRNLEKRLERGAGMIEFAVVALLCTLLLLAFVEFGRMLLVYNAVANAAREGVRYATVNGNGGGTRAGSTVEEVESVVRNFAATSPLNRDALSITVTYPDGSNSAGARVDVTVVYPYDPIVGYFPLQVNLASTSRGVITY